MAHEHRFFCLVRMCYCCACRNFRFATYLQKCEQEVVIEMAEVKESVWIGFILVVGVELYIKGIMGDAETGDVSSWWYLSTYSVVRRMPKTR